MSSEEKRELADYWLKAGIVKDRRLIDAFYAVPRENFVLSESVRLAYGDYPLPIGHGQTISQPTTVMIMTQALDAQPGDKVLEVGTGSGYQAALLSRLVEPGGRVVTTEIIPELAEYARSNLERILIKNVEVVPLDGSGGFMAYAPYDRIIVTAACPNIPAELIEQLKEGGIIVAPVSRPHFGQDMIRGEKVRGGLKAENLGGFVFVPLRGKHGYR
jgi:protein-L-isoaspartate(D-aspartate) O-methyltransferase